MKIFNTKIFPILLIAIIKESISKISNSETNIKENANEIVPDIDLRNFDIREKFYECYNPGYDADMIVFF